MEKTKNEIHCTNIIWIGVISKLGGVESFAYYMAKKYKDLDIMVLCKSGHINQLDRIRKYCPADEWHGEKVYCKEMIINCDTTILDSLEERRSHNGSPRRLHTAMLQTISKFYAPKNKTNTSDYFLHPGKHEEAVQY